VVGKEAIFPVFSQTPFNELKDNGFLTLNFIGVNINVTLRMLTATADNPAKEALENYKSTACGLCHQEG